MASAILLSLVSYKYPFSTSGTRFALMHVSLKLPVGSFTMIVGRTGSGKSTLAQMCGGLLKPTSGLVKIGHLVITPETKRSALLAIHRQTGIVFQVPKDQLFGTTVAQDLSFAPRNFGMKNHLGELIQQVSRQVGLSPKLLAASPFDLSGGQMRRVAIGDVLIYRPRVLILDEPTVGLDYYGRLRLMTLLANLHRRRLTILMVTHEMDLVAKYASQVVVMNRGRVISQTTSRRLFNDDDLLKRAGLLAPFAPRFAKSLAKRGFRLPYLPLTTSELVNELGSQMTD